MLDLLSVCCIGGVALGAILASKIIETSRRGPILIFNWIAMIGCMVSIIENFTIICIGRFIFGFSTGILLIAAPKVLEESIPNKYMWKGYGATTNIFVMLAIMMNMLLSTMIPETGLNTKTKDVDCFWQVIYLLPMATSALSLMMFLLNHNTDSLL